MNEIAEDLWIGDIQDVRRQPLGRLGIDRVITVCQDSVADNVGCAYEHYELEDGEHQYGVFRAAVDAVRAARADGETIMLHCHLGQSRSPSVAAAALAVEDGVPVIETFEKIRERRMIHPKPELQESARRYAAEE